MARSGHEESVQRRSQPPQLGSLDNQHGRKQCRHHNPRWPCLHLHPTAGGDGENDDEDEEGDDEEEGDQRLLR